VADINTHTTDKRSCFKNKTDVWMSLQTIESLGFNL